MKFDLSRFGISERDLPPNWEVKSLGDIADFNPEQISKTYPHSMIQYLDIGNVSAGQIGIPVEVSRTDAPSRAQRMVKTGDTILSTVRPGNRAYAFIQKPPENLIVSTGFAVLRAKADISQRFLYYLATSAPIIDYLASIAEEKSAYPSVNPSDIAECLVPVPASKHEQDRIATILGAADDKIELNRRMNETLEAMARAIFKSWFVDFDPVRAKAAGKPTGLPKEISDLFPSRLVNSELGEIPECWNVKPFSETIEIISGGTPKTTVAEYWDGDIPWFSVVDSPSDSDIWVLDTVKKVTQEGVQNSATQLLPFGTTIISARGTVGKVALVGVPMAMNQSCYGLRGRVGTLGLHNYFATRELVAILQQHTHGSVFDTITRDTFVGVSVPTPPATIIELFEKQVESTMLKIRSNLHESNTLSTMRDSLLPKLISGEIRMP